MKIKIDILNPRPGTIWDELTKKLGRTPTAAECKAECLRILNRPVYVITGTKGGKAISRNFDTLEAAKDTAGRIYRETGTIVGIEERRKA
jgi:hypothetical protein